MTSTNNSFYLNILTEEKIMKLYKKVFAICLLAILISPLIAQAADGDWKVGRLYYRNVCTDCHKGQSCGAIAPSTKTKAEWAAYLDADSHAKGKDKVSYYVSPEFRDSIKDTNKAAAKFLKVPADKLMLDIRAFVIHGAKDSDSPASCS
jgi:hypothetical protein